MTDTPVNVGDRVLYFPGSFDKDFAPTADTHPLAAIVAFVPDAPPPPAQDAPKIPVTVNLMVIDQNGWTHSRTNVVLLADGDEPIPSTAYAGSPARLAKKVEAQKKADADAKAANDKQAAATAAKDPAAKAAAVAKAKADEAAAAKALADAEA
jgi:hypothetical protein